MFDRAGDHHPTFSPGGSDPDSGTAYHSRALGVHMLAKA